PDAVGNTTPRGAHEDLAPDVFCEGVADRPGGHVDRADDSDRLRADIEFLEDEVGRVAIAVEIPSALVRLEGQELHLAAEHAIRQARIAGLEAARGDHLSGANERMCRGVVD